MFLGSPRKKRWPTKKIKAQEDSDEVRWEPMKRLRNGKEKGALSLELHTLRVGSPSGDAATRVRLESLIAELPFGLTGKGGGWGVEGRLSQSFRDRARHNA